MSSRDARIFRMQRRVENVDPTRTVTLRRAFMAAAMRRFRELQRAITASVAGRDIFRLGQTAPTTRLAVRPASSDAFAPLTPAERIAAFEVWLQEQEAAGVLETVPGPGGVGEPWSNQYIRSSYQSGLSNATRELRGKGIEVPPTVLPGPGGVGGVFLSPFHQSRVQVLFTETFAGLENVTAAMNTQIVRVLAEGMAEGIGPEEMARRINNRVDKIGRTRARLIARTETVKAYNTAQTFEFQRVEGIIGEEVFVQWWTAEDERVRASHRERHGKVYTKEEYLTLIGEPNCRCTGLPYVMGVDGETEVTTAGETRAKEAEQAAKDKEESARRREERRRAA